MARTIRTKVYKFNELSKPAQEKALNDEIQSMIEYEFKDHYENWPEFKAAADKCERMQTPWFLGSYIFDACGNAIKESLQEREYEYFQDGQLIPAKYYDKAEPDEIPIDTAVRISRES